MFAPVGFKRILSLLDISMVFIPRSFHLRFGRRVAPVGFKRILALLDINMLFVSPETFICVSEGGLFLPRWALKGFYHCWT